MLRCFQVSWGLFGVRFWKAARFRTARTDFIGFSYEINALYF